MQPLDVMTAISAKTGDLGAAYYFHPDTLARGKELGLDGFRFYLLGRAGVLGDVEADVVRAAFGYFAPELVAKLWDSAKERVAPREAAREHLACNAALGNALFASIDDQVLTAYVDSAAAVVAAVDVSGLPLFAGLRSEPVPAGTGAAAIHHAVLLRELRGSAHLVAVRSTGMQSHIAHAIKRPGDVETFGWPADLEITEADRERLVRAEAITDDILESAFAVLDAAQGQALVDGTEALYAALNG